MILLCFLGRQPKYLYPSLTFLQQYLKYFTSFQGLPSPTQPSLIAALWPLMTVLVDIFTCQAVSAYLTVQTVAGVNVHLVTQTVRLKISVITAAVSFVIPPAAGYFNCSSLML